MSTTDKSSGFLPRVGFGGGEGRVSQIEEINCWWESIGRDYYVGVALNPIGNKGAVTY